MPLPITLALRIPLSRVWLRGAAGIIATFPIDASVLTSFAQRTRGPAEAILVLRGLLYGSPGFATFCLLVGVLLGSTGIAMAFALSLGAALASRAPRWSSS